MKYYLPSILMLCLTCLIACHGSVDDVAKVAGVEQASIENAFSFSFEPASFDFGPQRTYSSLTEKIIKIKNVNSDAVFINAITGTNTHFTIVSDTCPRTPSVLAPDKLCEATIRFTPQAAGSLSTTLTLTYGSSLERQSLANTMEITGTGVGDLVFSGLESVDPISTTKATLNWTHLDGVLNYFIFSVSNNGVPTLVTTITPPTATYQLTGLTPDTTYKYYVKAIDQFGAQDSNTKQVEFTTNSSGTFAAISNLSVAEGATGQTGTLDCSDDDGNTPAYAIVSQSDSDATCTLTSTPIKVSCSPTAKTGHSNWTSAVAVSCDLNDSSFTQSFTVTVSDVNRSPSLDAIANQTVGATSAITTIDAGDGGNDTDADLDALTYSCTFSGGGNAAGTACSSLPNTAVSFNTATGGLDWTPSIAAAVGNVDTTYTFTFLASDGQSTPLTSSRNFTIIVQPATPLITSVSDYIFPSDYIDQGEVLSLDFNNIRGGSPGNDTGMTYACVYDQTIDNAVAAGTNCTSLLGSVALSTSLGTFSWTPDKTVQGAFEIKFSGTNAGGTDTAIFVVNVRPVYVLTHLTGNYDAQFANLNAPNSGTVATWKDLTTNAFDAAMEGNADSSWTGTGVYSSPYRSQLGGNGRIDFGSTPMASQTKMLISAWIAPSSVSTANATLIGNSSNATGNGFTIHQSRASSGKLEFMIGSYATVIQSDAPVGYWRLTESTGSAASDVMNAYAGTYSGDYTLAAGGPITSNGLTSVLFNSTTNTGKVQLTSPIITGTGDFTIEAWIYATSGGTTRGIVNNYSGSNTGGVEFYVSVNNKLCLYISGNLCGNTNVATDTWYYVAATRSSGTATVYLNGVADGSQSLSTSITGTRNLAIANGPDYVSERWYGRIAEVAVYGSALSAAKILAHYQAGTGCRSTSTFTNGAWNYVAGLFDGTTANLFVNGRSECSWTKPAGATFTTPATNLVAGSSSASAQANAWSGDMADFKLYTTGDGTAVATATDVHTNFTATADRFREIPLGNTITSGLVLHVDASNANRGLTKYANGCAAADLSWFDLSASGLSGTLTNFASCGASSGWNGTGTAADPYRITFDGTNDVVNFGDVELTNDKTLTLCAWFKSASIIRDAGILSKYYNSGNGFHLGGDTSASSNKIEFQASSSACDALSNTTLNDNVWHHVCGVYNGNLASANAKLYVDGTLQTDTSDCTAIISNTTDSVTVGGLANGAGTGYYFIGSIGHAAAYNVALSAAEVLQNCNALKARYSGATCN